MIRVPTPEELALLPLPDDAVPLDRSLPRVLVVGAHPMTGFSMRRYTRLLDAAYRTAGFRTRLLWPPMVLSRRLDGTLQKAAVFFEKAVLTPIVVGIAQRRAGIVHGADQGDAMGLALVPRAKSLVTIHDLLAIRAARGEYPDHPLKWRGRLYQAFNLAWLRRVGAGACVSAVTLADAARLAPRLRLFVVRNPVDTAFGAPTPDEDLPPEARGRRYLFFISESNWRKQRERGLAVWAAAHAVDPSLGLIVNGPAFTDDELDRAAQLAEVDRSLFDQVTVLWIPSDDGLRALYAHAVASIQTSPYEGFGWPVLEANIAGVVAFCLDVPIYREFGDENLFISDDPLAEDWAQLLAEAESPQRRELVRAAALRQNPSAFSRQLAAGVRSGAAREDSAKIDQVGGRRGAGSPGHRRPSVHGAD